MVTDNQDAHDQRSELSELAAGLEAARATEFAAFEELERALGHRIRQLREARGWSQADLAASMNRHGFNLHQTAIAKIEGGKRPIRVSELFALGVCLGMSPAALFYMPEETFGDSDLAALDQLLQEIEEGAARTREQFLDSMSQLIRLEVDSEVRRQSIITRMAQIKGESNGEHPEAT
jgi:transcriptional regulator with XRE-family HTH domain